MPLDLNTALQTVNIHDTISCRAVAYGAVYKTVLSVDDTNLLMDYVSKQTGRTYKESIAMSVALPHITEFLGRVVKAVSWEIALGRRALIYHD